MAEETRHRAPSFRPGLALSLAFRGLRRDPGASLLAVGILTLGLAAPTVFFSMLVGATRPLPVPRGDRVVRVDVVQPSGDGRELPVKVSDLAVLKGTAGLQGLGGFTEFQATLVDRDRAGVRLSAAGLTPEVLPLLGVAPALGRMPGPQDAGDALLLGHDVFEEIYDGDPGVVGRTVSLNGAPRTVVGIMPEGFGFPFKQDAWTILDEAPGDGTQIELVGRLADGADPGAPAAELGARWSAGDLDRPAAERGGVVQVRAYTGSRGERGEAIAFVGLVLVALCLLVIACANVANLLLVRATERVRFLGVQAALGAGRLQLGAQVVFEAMLVAVGGGAFGLLVAWWSVGVLQRTLGPEHFGYYWMRLAVDWPVVAFTSALVVGTAVLSGVLPVVRVLRVDVVRVLKEDGAGAAVVGGGLWSRVFVTGQLALSCGALVAAGLTTRALAESRDFGRGVPGHELLVASVEAHRPDGATVPGLVTDLREELARLPGARAAAVAIGAPGYLEPYSPMELAGVTYPRSRDRPGTLWNAVSPGFFDVFGLALRSGRVLEDGDVRGAPKVALVSESWVRRYSPSESPLGRRIRLIQDDSAAWLTVVGVVADVDLGGGRLAREDRVYVPLAQADPARLMLLVRTPGEPTALTSDLRRMVAQVDPSLAVWDVRTLADAYAYLIRVPRALGTITLSGGLAGLLVAAVGLYGLLAFAVRQRRRELGVRLALGADAVRLFRDVLGLALRQILPGAAIGLTLAWVASPVLRALLLGGDPRSLSTYAMVAGAFLGSGLLAAMIPAVRAARVDPARTLRGE
ncbi:MAG: ABC transporter permease [Gemmatimonadetes bacterium]|nr:ABC transporter permease [Gemmatimonadota bacterium]